MKDLQFTELLKVKLELEETKCEKFYIFPNYSFQTVINDFKPDTLRITLDVDKYDFEGRFVLRSEAETIIKELLKELRKTGAKKLQDLYFTVKNEKFISKYLLEDEYEKDGYEISDFVYAIYRGIEIRCLRREAALFDLKVIDLEIF